jgi:pyruvyl transferase EpsO
VIQLPQTLHFSDASRLERTAAAIKRHGNFVLLVRDWRSYEIASRHFACETAMCPDMAFGLGPLTRPTPPPKGIVAILRTDKERASSDGGDTRERLSAALPDVHFTDWIVESNWLGRFAKLRAVSQHLALSGSKADFPATLLTARAEARLKRGLKILAEGRLVISDRLHAHILCVLAGVPHVILDNSYGKISGFRGAWTSGVGYARFSASVDEAVGAVAQF